MATIEDSDTFHDFYCTLCEKKDSHVRAIKRCEDCSESLCGDCLTNHAMFPAMREHSLVDNQDSEKPQQESDGPEEKRQQQESSCPDVPTIRCSTHPGNKVELYCGNHDGVGCAMCGNIDHNLCKDIRYVPDVAAGFKATSEPHDIANSLSALIDRTSKVKQARETDLKRVTKQRDTAVETIEQRVDAIKHRLDELKVVAIAEIEVQLRLLEETIMCDINRSCDLSKQLETEEERLKAALDEGESDLFVYVKQFKASIKESGKIVEKLEMIRGESLHVVIDDTILACMAGLDTFAKIGRPTELDLSVEQTPTVRMDDDKKGCLIADCCFLENGAMLLADSNNDCLKLFDTFYKSLDRCAVAGHPTAMCVVGEGDVAITIWDKKVVQFATVGEKIDLTSSFSVEGYGRGISYSNNNLFISCGGGLGERSGQVRIYDRSGTLLQKIKHGNLALPRHNIATTDGGCIVADRELGILALDKAGEILWKWTHVDLKHARGLCEIDDLLLVCCFKTGHVFQVNPVDQSSRIILQGSTELKKLRSLTYDVCNDKLIVMKESCDHLLVFKIERKYSSHSNKDEWLYVTPVVMT